MVAYPRVTIARVIAGEDVEAGSNQSFQPCVISSVSCSAWFVGIMPSIMVLVPVKVKLLCSSTIVTPGSTVSEPYTWIS